MLCFFSLLRMNLQETKMHCFIFFRVLERGKKREKSSSLRESFKNKPFMAVCIKFFK